MTSTPYPAVTVTCALPGCDEEVTPINPREGGEWAGMPFPVFTYCSAHQEAAELFVRGLIAAVHEDDEAVRAANAA